MRIWILSDLHMEQSDWDLPDPRPDYDVLVAAGDIHFATDGVCWLAERAAGKPVIYVPGNHEWYSYSRTFTVEEEQAEALCLAEAVGVHLLIDDEVTIDGVRFLGSSLWTDYELDGDAEAAMTLAACSMNDHRLIFPRRVGVPLEPREAREWHRRSRAWLEDRLGQPSADAARTVVVTHHLPHPRSIHQVYAGNALNPAFCSDLSKLVEAGGADFWIHGHVHTSCDYQAGGTRVVCNPKGYGPTRRGGAIENMAFDPGKTVRI